MSTTLKNIKIPYPTEGVIRSAQLNDTVAPDDSVQLAVNVNFDRVGAIQTRPGVETYATQLSSINNFGTLNNSITSAGFEQITKYIPTDEISAINGENLASIGIGSSRFLIFRSSATDNKGYANVVTVDRDTGNMTEGASLTFDTTFNDFNSCAQIDSTHFINVWQGGANGHSYAQVFSVGSTTVSKIGSPLKFDATESISHSLVQVDANHFLDFWYSIGSTIGKAQVLEVNLSTFAVTAIGSPLTFYNASATANSSCKLDATHFVNCWDSAGGGQARVFTVNLGTYAVTTAGAEFNFDANNGDYNNCKKIDATHFINSWISSTGPKSQVFSVDGGTFAITAISTALAIDSSGFNISVVDGGDNQHFIAFWEKSSSGLKVYGQILSVNLSTFVVTASNTSLLAGTTDGSAIFSSLLLNSSNVVAIWPEDSNVVASLFELEGATTSYNYLYAQDGYTTIKNWDGANWTTVRSGLKNGQKARFAQYLNYLWMVNGNSQVGDPVATSNGGAFGSTLVPYNLPSGDFIQAGFEGRVWIADKLQDILYYTDIVQFNYPSNFSLSFDLSVNFIKNFSPQNGEKITALWQVPRALLLFKENHIYRIYGANSVDSYPAYNVGTFSQESIVETKDGIYFHHSSGFYKFDYGGQPVEISRRIIDFVQAIPSSYYENIVGEWDGFDAIKWYIGPVTVEGVTFSNCVVRYTISTQVWTIYNYKDNVITAAVRYDNGTTISQVIGTSLGKVCSLDIGTTDLGQPIHYEIIDRWRSFTEMYAKSKSVSGMNVYTENGAGMRVEYQVEKTIPDKWTYIDTVNENYDALFPNASTDDFAVIRFRYTGQNSGAPIIFHGVELLSIQDKGFDQN